MHPLDSSRFGELVLFCSLSAIIKLFVHPLSWLSCFARGRGLSKCAYGIRVLRLSVHPVDSFRVLILRVFFLRNYDF